MTNHWICCTIKVILAYEPTTVKPVCKIKTMSLYNRCQQAKR